MSPKGQGGAGQRSGRKWRATQDSGRVTTTRGQPLPQPLISSLTAWQVAGASFPFLTRTSERLRAAQGRRSRLLTLFSLWFQAGL